MKQIAQYYILRHQPYPNRSEHLNIGVVVLRDGNRWRAHFAANLRRLKAFDPQVNIDNLRQWEVDLPVMLAGMDPAKAVALLGQFGTWRLSETCGHFIYHDEHEYTQRINEALASLAEPRSPLKTQREPKSRLFVDIRKAFEMQGWLGTEDQINEHRIVPRYPISREEGVSAEFALRNGKLHLIETVDFRVNIASKRQEAMSKALVFDLAAQIEKKSVNAYVVVAGGQQDEAKSTVKLLNRYADNVLAWEDHGDMDRFLHRMADAVGRPFVTLPSGD